MVTTIEYPKLILAFDAYANPIQARNVVGAAENRVMITISDSLSVEPV